MVEDNRTGQHAAKSGEHGQARHETRDVSIMPLFQFGVALAVVTIVVFLLMAWMFNYFSSRESQTPAAGGSWLARERELPPEPRLQVDPAQELNQLRETEHQILNSYGWVDREEGVARVPIERAMELLLKQGLPEKRDEKTANKR